MCGVLGMSYSEDPRNPAWTWPGRGRSGCLSLDNNSSNKTLACDGLMDDSVNQPLSPIFCIGAGQNLNLSVIGL